MAHVNLYNIRLGLATNSSSSHSLIFLPKGEKVSDDHHGTAFGWSYFTLASPEAKRDYLGVILKSTLDEYKVDEAFQVEILKDWLTDQGDGSLELSETDLNDIMDGYIDHQSRLLIPKGYGTNKPSRAFFDTLYRFMMQDNLVIGGGNDNDSEQHDAAGIAGAQSISVGDLAFAETFECVVRRDREQDFWTLFWPSNGTKVRFSFDLTNANHTQQPRYAETPELVDLTLTHYCPYSCFPAGTMVATVEGDKPIELIDRSDSVASLNVDTLVQGYQPVTEISSYDHDGDLIVVRLTNNEIIHATPNHEFWTVNRGWVPAEYLLTSDVLWAFQPATTEQSVGSEIENDLDGLDDTTQYNPVTIADIERVHFDGVVYNLTVANAHNYFANGVLVHNCEFCYMGSTRKGKHAKLENVKAIIDGLAEMEVFEVAIGGGEPTLHPDFVEVLAYAREKGMVPNFTTRNYAWLKDPQKVESIMEHAGAFAVSVDSYRDIFRLAHLLDKANIRFNRCNLHFVMGVIPKAEFELMLRAAARKGFRVTLLGYKTTGRGCDFEPVDYSWWLDLITRLRDEKVTYQHRRTWNTYDCPIISVDTVLAKEYDAELGKNGVPKWAYHTEDGGFSAYIDAVNLTMAPASYERLEKAVSFSANDTVSQQLREIFKGFRATKTV